MSLQNVFARMSVIAHLESGPLGSYLSGLASALGEQHYAVHTIQKCMHAADAFGRWLTKQKIELGDVDEQVVNRYVAGLQRRAAGSRSNLPSHLATGLHHLLQLLRRQGVIGPSQEIAPLSPTDRFLAAYRQYLERTLGSAPATVRQHLLFARRLINFAFVTQELDWAALCGETIAQFTLQQTKRRSGFGRKAPGSSIRVLLRYLVTRGELRAGLEAAVPKAREWKHASLPVHLSEAEVTKILEACDDGTDLGKRDLAILLLLSRLGLRAGEAIRLKIDDLKLEADPPYLQVLETKYRKSRLVPLHPTTATQLRSYTEKRRQLGYSVLSDHFFISERGNPLNRHTLWRTFNRMTRRLEMHPTDGRRRPTLHSLRHGFAIERLRKWYQAGVDVRAMLPHLSVYLGHLRPQDSYWYLTATPELLTAAGERFRQYAETGGEQ